MNMISLPSIDYSPLTKRFTPDIKVRQILDIKDSWLPDSKYYGGHATFSMGQEEVTRAAKLYMFAIQNSFGFIGNLPGILPFPRSHFHSFATLNYPTMITHGIIIPLQEGWLEIGELRFDDASQYKPQDTRFTYAKVTIAQQLPDLTIDSLGAGLPTNSYGKQVYITESNEFNRHFKLFLDKNHAHSGLKILSPDVMAQLIDHFLGFDIEMRDHTISLLTYGRDLTDPDVIKEFIETLLLLFNELSYQIRYPVDPKLLPADIEAYKRLYGYTKDSGKTGRKSSHVGLIVCIVIILFSVLATIAFIATG